MTRDATYWDRRRSARQRWSKNAVRRKAAMRIERALAPQSEYPNGDACKIKPRWDWKINIERGDGQKIQIKVASLDGKFFSRGISESPKEFAKRLGILFHHGTLL